MSTDETPIPTDETSDRPEGQDGCCGAGGSCQGDACGPDASEREAKIAELTDQLQRSVAESQNMKKRFERDREELATFAGSAVLLVLLPILDELDRAVAHLPAELAENDWARGVVHVRANLEKTLHALGVERVGTKGDAYDPSLHEAIAKGDGAPDTIASVFESGYRYRGKLLRPAKVVVGGSSNDTPPESPTT